MRGIFLAAQCAAISLIAFPAAATIAIYTSPGAVQPAENVLFSGPDPIGNTVIGFTNQTQTRVTFNGIEPLVSPPAGQARIEATDGGLTELSFGLDPGLGFKEVEFDLFGTHAEATQVVLNFTDQFSTIFAGTYAIHQGGNFFSARAFDNQLITNVRFMLDGPIIDAGQFRIGGVGEAGAVPEPAMWAMMMAGMGLVGVAMRRRKAALAAA
ncbi:hypothetical protein CHU93_13175 [Sandarakinorhabdus cyanobacteriorum]|uniref:Ice-binding protein C-terminal domain-containing protein n=1 Tax=Sandarakinorhabdus cyanobacteriorum TaxID=1981098 RepID=A0A255Y8Y8_9SPHN|nr:hypothetical protein CHU93_13175 [Sandarakinorhabdus cyanobacteriorum]